MVRVKYFDSCLYFGGQIFYNQNDMGEEQSLKLGQVLCREGLLEQDQLFEVLEVQKVDPRRIGELVVDKGWVTEKQLAENLAKMFQLPYVSLTDETIDKEAFKLISYELTQTHQVLPIAVNGNTITLATNNPLDLNALQEIQYKSGYLIEPVMASLTEIQEHLQEHAHSFLTLDAEKKEEDSQQASSSTIVSLVDSIIHAAIHERASDIHFEPHKDKMRVRFRIDGVLYEKSPVARELQRNVIARIKIIAGMDVAETRRPQDGRTTFTHAGVEYDLRISTLCNIYGENLVLRILSKKFASRSFESLGMDAAEVNMMTELMGRPHGLILVSGPTGAGKSTTLYSLMTQLNDVAKNIISVEDPVEYELEGINQTPVNSYIGYTFASAMRNILRHDPDIIMLGEIRDVETADAAIRAALTGHLVLSTVHTNTAAGAVTRLLEMGIEPFLIGSSVIGVVAQRLVRALCPDCRREYTPDQETIDLIKGYVPFKNGTKLAEAVGCDKCFNTGYVGRTGIFEILCIDKAMKDMIVKSADESDLAAHAQKKGMTTLRQSGLMKVMQQQTTLEEVMRITTIE